MNTRPFAAATLVAAAVALTGGCRRGGQEVAADPAVPVQSVAVQRTVFPRSVEITGPLVAVTQASITSPASGVIAEVLVTEGQQVIEGQLLLRFDTRELQLEADRAASALGQTEAELGIARDREAPARVEDVLIVRQAATAVTAAREQNARYEQLGVRGLVAAMDVEATRSRLKLAENAHSVAVESAKIQLGILESRRSAFEDARKAVEAARVTSPIAGRVLELAAHPSQLVATETPLAIVAQPDPLKLVGTVDPRYAAALRLGMDVDVAVTTLGAEMFKAKLSSLTPSSDPLSVGLSLELVVKNTDDRLAPGAVGRVAIPTDIKDEVLTVPQEAVVTANGVSSVFLIAGRIVRSQSVTIGARQNGLVEIVNGVAAGSRVVTSGLDQLSDGAAVNDLNALPAAAPTR